MRLQSPGSLDPWYKQSNCLPWEQSPFMIESQPWVTILSSFFFFFALIFLFFIVLYGFSNIPPYSMDMNLSKLWEIVKDRGAWCAAAHEVTKNRSWLNDWTAHSTHNRAYYRNIWIIHKNKKEKHNLVYHQKAHSVGNLWYISIKYSSTLSLKYTYISYIILCVL